jgi:chromosome segregation ATPase
LSAADTFLEIAKVVGPAATGVGGALATLWKTTHGIFNKLSVLEKDAVQCEERHRDVLLRFGSADDRLDESDRRSKALESGIDGLMSVLGKIHVEIAKLRASLSSYVTQATYAKQLERMASLERHASELDEELARQNVTMIRFAKEQHEQWQVAIRSIGRLEGVVRGRESFHDG